MELRLPLVALVCCALRFLELLMRWLSAGLKSEGHCREPENEHGYDRYKPAVIARAR
jgi:hypothetical protein